MITGTAHVCIGATNLKSSEHFYCDLLGLTKRFSYYHGDVERGFYLSLQDGTFLEVFYQESADPNFSAPIRHFCLTTDNIDDLRAKLVAAGVEVSEKQRGKDRSWQIWITDPTGIKVEVQEYTSESRQRTGIDYRD